MSSPPVAIPSTAPDAPDFQTIRSIQFADPPTLREIVPTLSLELEGVILRCLEKQPSARFNSAADIREALRTIMRTMQLDSVLLPAEAFHLTPTQQTGAESEAQEKRSSGILSLLAERFREPAANATSRQKSVVVLPFIDFSAVNSSPLYGHALADALGARLARMPSLVIRPSSALMTISMQGMDPLAIGRKLVVQFVLAGNFMRSEKGFDLNWQLLDVAGQSVRTGGSINVATFDLVAVQTEICNEVFSTLQGFGDLSANPRRLRLPL